MRNFKRTLKMTLAFFLFVNAIYIPITQVYYNNAYYNYQDSAERKSLAGSIDLIVCGSSQAFRCFVPDIMDQEIGCNSYNTASALMTMKGRYTILKKEMERNQVKTVVLELSYNSMSRDRNEEGPEGDIYVLGRLDNFAERMVYAVTTLRINEYDRVLYDTLDRGVYSVKRKICKDENIRVNSKGYGKIKMNDCSVSAEDYGKTYHKKTFSEEINSENLKYLTKIADMCDSYGAKVIVVVTPLTDGFISEYDNMEKVMSFYVDFSSERGYDFYDFNLLKNKTEIFSNKTSFYDESHLCESGANEFTFLFSRLVVNGETMQSRPDLFYRSYSEAEKNGAFSEKFAQS